MTCGRCASPLEEGDLRCAICALPVPAAPPTREAIVRAQVLRCRECNAAVAFDAAAQAPSCGFCGATMAIEQPVDPIERAELRIPFAVSREVAEQAVRGWLGRRGWFAPRALRDEAVIETLQPLCWAGWIVDADAQVAWTADSDHDAQRAAWAPHAGQVRLRFEAICVPASRGLAPDECAALTPFYALGRAIPVDRTFEGEAPAMIEAFDAQRSAARALVQRGIEAAARTRVEPAIPGRRFRNVRVACLLERQTTRRVALPAWVLAYRYRGAPYRAIVHGERPEIVIGNAPKDWKKLALLAALLALVVAVIAFVVVKRSGG